MGYERKKLDKQDATPFFIQTKMFLQQISINFTSKQKYNFIGHIGAKHYDSLANSQKLSETLHREQNS